jgi:AcrR family transcriptional regulator
MIMAMSSVKDGPSRRRYRSAVRAEGAEQTRSRIVRAALAEFLEHGYVATTVDRIAARAEVSRPTVFALGPKATLLKLARDIAIAGDDDEVAIMERPEWRQLADAPDAEGSLRAYAAISASILQRFAPVNEVLRQAAAVDPEAHPLWQVSERERLIGARRVVATVAAKGRLRDGLDKVHASEVLWLLTAPEQYQRLVRDRGWSQRRFSRWHADTMVRLLLS